VDCKSAVGSVTMPAKCEVGVQQGEDCGPNPYVIIPDGCEFVDQQSLKLQECPESVPTGEMPRHFLLMADRYLVDRVSPGTRVNVLAVKSLYSSIDRKKLAVASIRTPYLRVIGLMVDSDNAGRDFLSFTPEDESRLQALSKDPDIYEKFARSIAPQISGEYTKDIKKALTCLLMGGSRKVLPDGIRLRGDINVLLMGDPSTAKSQFLKFIERVSPVGVYTSGKGSSAAGLTASVIKDSRGEFFLEGGAMVLADGGVICIDEFDKMRESDRVAIHEAMEQQTISIAKAGITCVLNSRVSVLAAANPIYGRYDELKSIADNIDLMSTILSRFDCIFIVRDVRDAVRDREIAQHVMGVHINAASSADASTREGEIDSPTMKKYIAYCRERCAPRLTEAAGGLLNSQYVQIRNQVRISLANTPGSSQVVPITIRQLEALVRLSESLAKLRLSAEANEADVEEALRLFKISTLATSQANPALFGLGVASDSTKKCEDYLRRRLGLRLSTHSKQVVEEATLQGYSSDAVKCAIAAMVLRNEIVEKNQGKLLMRIK
jgi:DNA replication licensing factor MCM5